MSRCPQADTHPNTSPLIRKPCASPDTGVESGDIARLGLQTGALGALFCALAVGLTPLRRAMNNHRKDHQ